MRLLALAALFAAVPASAQEPVTLAPGHPDLVAVAPQSVTLTIKLVQPMQQDIGTVITTEILEGDQLVFTSDIQVPQAGQNQQDTTVVAYPSLEPISRVEVSTDETERATFAGGRMTGTVSTDETSYDVEAVLEGAFGPGITRRLVRSLPFAPGYVASFNQIDGDGEISTSTLSVTGQEAHTRPDGTESTVWVVLEVEPGAPDYAYYVDAETRELLKVAFAPQPGVRVEMIAE